jgi:hypothetical protein
VAERTSQTEHLAVRQQLAGLVQEYETIRSTMDSGDPRTRKMEVVVSKMRALGLAGYPMLPELAASASPGQRLAAVVILQSIPNPDYIPWLAQRLRVDAPFVGYHAAVALLTAVRALHTSHRQELRKAIAAAKKDLEENMGRDRAIHTDRYTVLDEAEQELQPLANNAAMKGEDQGV